MATEHPPTQPASAQFVTPEWERTTRPTICDGVVVDYRLRGMHISASRNQVCTHDSEIRTTIDYSEFVRTLNRAQNEHLALARGREVPR